MQIALHTAAGKFCLKLICLLVITAYMAIAARDYVAFHLGASPERHAMEEAIALEPSNAEYRHDFGSYLMFSERRPDLAIPYYRSAVTLKAYSAEYWVDLARAYAATGDNNHQEVALKQALGVDPNTPSVIWEVANAFLTRRDLQQGFRLFRILLATDPSRMETTLQVCWFTTHDVDIMLRDVLPATPSAHLEFLKLLTGEGEREGAKQVWARLIALREQFDPQLAKSYTEYLIAQGDIAQAQAAWSDLGRIDVGFQPYLASAANLVVNGGFEQKPQNMGFDWRYADSPGANLALDAKQFHSGDRSLSVAFVGRAVVDVGLSQFIPVNPSTRYNFRAFVKSDNIFAANGPRFAISDAEAKKPLLVTEEVLETTDWRQIGGVLTTGPSTHLLLLQITRASDAGPITGKLWVDDVSLVQQ
jgi:tetratricopeptide (TPR) repeat protein